jgi:hypothetical protein
MLALACILVGLVSVFMLTRRTWRRDSVIGSQLSPRIPRREEAP